MATNADKEDESLKDDDKEVTEDDLRSLKYDADGVEISKEKDEPTDEEDEGTDTQDKVAGDDDEQIEDEADKGEEKSEPTFTKKFPNIKGDTPEEYAANLEAAYENSTSEYHKLRTQAAAKDEPKKDDKDDKPADKPASDVATLYMEQKMDEEIQSAFTSFRKDYPQVAEQSDYDAFTREVDLLSRTILSSQKRLAPPAELYSKAAVILGWEKQGEPTEAEKLKMSVKDGAGASKSTSSTKSKSKSKVTDAMISVNRKMYPDKTDAQIREELEPHIA